MVLLLIKSVIAGADVSSSLRGIEDAEGCTVIAGEWVFILQRSVDVQSHRASLNRVNNIWRQRTNGNVHRGGMPRPDNSPTWLVGESFISRALREWGVGWQYPRPTLCSHNGWTMADIFQNDFYCHFLVGDEFESGCIFEYDPGSLAGLKRLTHQPPLSETDHRVGTSEYDQPESKFFDGAPSLPKIFLLWLFLRAAGAIPAALAIEYGMVRGRFSLFVVFFLATLLSIHLALQWILYVDGK